MYIYALRNQVEILNEEKRKGKETEKEKQKVGNYDFRNFFSFPFLSFKLSKQHKIVNLVCFSIIFISFS